LSPASPSGPQASLGDGQLGYAARRGDLERVDPHAYFGTIGSGRPRRASTPTNAGSACTASTYARAGRVEIHPVRREPRRHRARNHRVRDRERAEQETARPMPRAARARSAARARASASAAGVWPLARAESVAMTSIGISVRSAANPECISALTDRAPRARSARSARPQVRVGPRRATRRSRASPRSRGPSACSTGTRTRRVDRPDISVAVLRRVERDHAGLEWRAGVRERHVGPERPRRVPACCRRRA